MEAFHNDKKIKSELLKQLVGHYKADEIIKGQYWQKGKGCAVGCTIHGSNHKEYETKLGIPLILARLEDRIFEGLSNVEAKKFPLEFIKAIKPGADLSQVYRHFLVYILVDEIDGVINFTQSEQSKKAIIGVSEIFTQNITDIKEIYKRKESVADAYAYATAYAAAYATDAYAYATAYAAAYAAAYATDAYAYAAAYAAAAYAAAAYATAYATDAADARQKHYSKMKTKLLQLLKDCK